MAENPQLVLEIAAILNSESVLAESKKMYAEASKLPPIQFNTVFGGATGTDAVQKSFDEIKDKASKIGDVTAQITKIKDAAGNIKEVITSTTTTWVDKMGVMQKTTTPVVAGINEVKNATEILSKTTATANLGAGVTAHLNEFDKYGKKIADVGKTAEKYASQAVSWDAKKQEALKKLQGELDKVVAAYNRLKPEQAGSVKEAERLVAESARLKTEMDKVNASVHTGANVFQNWGNRLTNAIKNTITYTFTLGSMRKAQQLLNEAIRFNIELNTEMTKIQILQAEGAQTPEEITALANSYNKLAQELGATTLEIAKGSVEWMRQGKTIEETRELLKASTMMSKLGNLEAAQSTEYLTSVLNGYQMEASEAINVVSKLVAVDNVAATSVNELATALRYSSAVAAEAGVSFEQLVSYIAVISQTTRQNAEMIGQALKTIFTRMQDVMQGGLDEDGLGINNVERALQRVNMTIMESDTEFRDLGGVLEELSGKWNTLNEVEQSNIAKAIAGTRQRNMFLILMQEMSTALELQEVQFNSAGLAVDRYGIYLESIEAKQAQLKNAMQALYMEEGFQDLIKNLIDITTWILKAIETMGGLKGALIILATATAIYTNNVIKASIATGTFASSAIPMAIRSIYQYITNLFIASTAQGVVVIGLKALILNIKAFGKAIVASMSTNFVGWILLAVGALVYLITTLKTSKERLEEFNEEIQKTKDAIPELRNQAREVRELTERYKELKNQSFLTREETEEFIDIQNRLLDLFPDLKGSFDAYGNWIISDAENIDRLTKETYELIEAKKQLLLIQQESSSYESGENLGDLYEKMVLAKGKADRNPDNKQYEQEFKVARELYRAELDRILPIFETYGEEAAKSFMIGLQAGSGFTYGDVLTKDFENAIETYKEDKLEDFGASIYQQAIDKFKKAAEASHAAALQQIEDDGDIQAFLSQTISDFEKLADIKNKNSMGGVLTREELDLMHSYNITLEELPGTFNIVTSSMEELIDNTIDLKYENGELNETEADLVKGLLKAKYAADEQADALKEIQSSVDIAASAIQEYNENGTLSVDTMGKIISAGLGQYLIQEGDAWRLNTQAIYDDIQAEMQAYMARLAGNGVLSNADQILAAVNAKTWEHALALIAESDASDEAKSSLTGYVMSLHSVATALAGLGSALGGGGSSGKSAEEQAIDDQIEAYGDKKKAVQDSAKEQIDWINKIIKGLEKEIKAIDKQIDKIKERADKRIEAIEEEIDAFKKIIDERKKLLKLEKEEDDYNKEQGKRGEELAKLRSDILLLSLDDSQEATAKRLELEEEAKNLEVDITENAEDRKYDLQIQALEDLEQEFTETKEAEIEAIEEVRDRQIRALEARKEKIQEQIEAYRELIDTINEQMQALIEAIDREIDALKKLADELKKTGGAGGSAFDGANTGANKLNQALINAKRNAEMLRLELEKSQGKTRGSPRDWVMNPSNEGISAFPVHSGGIIESHHEGNFAGNLRSNEVFAKLLKGEYVATENQMDNFLKNILPKIAEMRGRAMVERTEFAGGGGNVNVGDIIINVSGNLDKTAVPKIKKEIFEVMNEAMRQKGKKANAFSYSV